MRIEEYNKLPDRVSTKEFQNMFEDILKNMKMKRYQKRNF